MGWVWTRDESSKTVIKARQVVVFLIMIVSVLLLASLYLVLVGNLDGAYGAMFLAVMLMIYLAFIVYNSQSIKRDISTLRKVKIDDGNIVMDISGNIVSYRLNEVVMCYSVTNFDNFNGRFIPINYAVYIQYPGGTVRIPSLKPEELGELRHALKMYNVEIKECGY